MATITKSYTNILSPQSLASNSVVISSVLDVSTKLGASIFIHFGRRAATALTEGVEFRVEGSSIASGDGHWHPLAVMKTAIAASEPEAVTGTVSAGTNVVTVASTANLAAGDLVFIDNTTIGNSEWGRVKSIVANTSITLEDNLVNAQTGATIYDQAEIYPPIQLDLLSIARLRVVADGRNTGQAVALEVRMVTGDSIG